MLEAKYIRELIADEPKFYGLPKGQLDHFSWILAKVADRYRVEQPRFRAELEIAAAQGLLTINEVRSLNGFDEIDHPDFSGRHLPGCPAVTHGTTSTI